jgi:hypothetical protein
MSKQCARYQCSNNISSWMTSMFIPYKLMKNKFCMITIAKLWPIKFVIWRVLLQYHALILKMHWDVDIIMQFTHNLKLLCNLEVMHGHSCIMPMLEGQNELIKFFQSQKCFVCDFVVTMKLCQEDLYYLVQWPPKCLSKWCVPWLSKEIERNFWCGGAWMGT